VFRTKGILKYHYAIHKNERPFGCEWPGCEMRFISGRDLNRHRPSHHTQPKFKCHWPQCGRTFKAEGRFLTICFVICFYWDLIYSLLWKFFKTEYLNRHIAVHKGEKPIKCDQMGCDMRFKDRKLMRKHFRRKHIPK